MREDKHHIKVVDENGVVWNTLKECLRQWGDKPNIGGQKYRRLHDTGKISYHGHLVKIAEDDVAYNPSLAANIGRSPKKVATTNPLFAKLKQRFTDKELEMIAKGEGIKQNFIPYPEIHLSGNHHRILVMSDTHIGSVYSPKDWHDVVASFANDPKNNIECILHCGDLVEGMKIGRMGTQIYELSEVGYTAQRDEAIRLMSKYNPPIYIISGNHDRFFVENFGCDIVQDVCNNVPNMTKIGDDTADIDIDGCKIRLFHGGDGSSYAISYSLQKLVESINGGNKPNILIRGHIHKYCTLFTRNIHSISCPAMEAQTSFMRGKKLEAHIGFLVLDFDTKDGQVCNLGVTLYPFYA